MKNIEDLVFQIDRYETKEEGWRRSVLIPATIEEIEEIFGTADGDMTLVSQMCRELRRLWKYCSYLQSVNYGTVLEYEEFKQNERN